MDYKSLVTVVTFAVILFFSVVTPPLTSALRYSEILCKEDSIPCNPKECYNPKTQSCVGNNPMVCQAGQSFCFKELMFDRDGGIYLSSHIYKGQGECYYISSHACFAGHICNIGERLCRNSNDSTRFDESDMCYSPTTHFCIPGARHVKKSWGYFLEILAHLCPIDHKVCDNGTCYNPTIQTCIDDILCKVGEKLCGRTCYNPTAQACIDDKLCKVGEQLCSKRCFNNQTQECIQNSDGSTIVCNIGESVCKGNYGRPHICYNSTTHYCAKESHLCKIDEKLCNNVCQTSFGNKCFKVQYNNNELERSEFMW